MPGPDDGRPPEFGETPLGDAFGMRLSELRDEADKTDEDVLAGRRFARAREILRWLTAKSHYLEPPAFLLFQDGSGTLFVGSKTMETWPELSKEISRVVGSRRWGTRKRENGAEDITLHICGLELQEPIPELD